MYVAICRSCNKESPALLHRSTAEDVVEIHNEDAHDGDSVATVEGVLP
jgi:hypothetical protein